MPSLSGLLGNPITDILQGAGAIISKFVPDPAAKIAATEELAKLNADFQSKLLDADIAFAQAQAQTITAEAKSESWLARNWRPITMMVFVFIIAYDFIFAEIFSLKALPIPTDLWELLKLGIGGYIIGRSAEKIAKTGVTAYVAKQDAKSDNGGDNG